MQKHSDNSKDKIDDPRGSVTGKRGRRPKERTGKLTPGNKIANFRAHFHLGQDKIASLLEVSRGTVSSYETRPNASPGREGILRLAILYGVDPEWFYDGEDTPPRMQKQVAAEPIATVTETEVAVLHGAYVHSPLTEDVEELEASFVRWKEGHKKERTWMTHGLPGDSFRFVNALGMILRDRAPMGSTLLFMLEESPPLDSLILVKEDGGDDIFAALIEQSPNPKGVIVSFPYGSPLPLLLKDPARKEVILRFWAVAVAIVHPYRQGQPNIEFLDGDPLTFTYRDVAKYLDEENSEGRVRNFAQDYIVDPFDIGLLRVTRGTSK